jgi:hypothetical protein
MKRHFNSRHENMKCIPPPPPPPPKETRYDYIPAPPPPKETGYDYAPPSPRKSSAGYFKHERVIRRVNKVRFLFRYGVVMMTTLDHGVEECRRILLEDEEEEVEECRHSG